MQIGQFGNGHLESTSKMQTDLMAALDTFFDFLL
jgi:hypothetical protein